MKECFYESNDSRRAKRCYQRLTRWHPVIGYQSDMERSGYQKAVDARPSHMVSEKRETYDAFDYTQYIYEVFTPSKDGSGTLCLIIN